MAFRIHTDSTILPNEEVWVLESDAGDRIDVWPALGFNGYRWLVSPEAPNRSGTHGEDTKPQDLLFAAAPFFDGRHATRGGFPILFPFPNRIRAGRFSWHGKEYQLPLNDPTEKNAIHGFACRKPWRVLSHGTDQHGAWITGEYHARRDAPETRSLWPADHRIRVTYRLGERRLRVEAVIDNPDSVLLPFGLGYHPYFRMPLLGDERSSVQAPAEECWVLEESLPTGVRQGLEPLRDLRSPRPFVDLYLDDVLTGLANDVRSEEGLCLRGAILGRPEPQPGPMALRLWTSADFTELVVFTPPHRQAICLEPYTCVTDAIHLHERNIQSGWKVLAPGETWQGMVELTLGRAR